MFGKNRIKIGFAITVALILLTIALYTCQPLGDNFYMVADVWVTAAALLAVLSGFYAYRIHGLKSVQGKALFFIMLGTLFFFLGEFTWASYELMGYEKPVASIADIFWIIGYPFYFIGFYCVSRLSSSHNNKKTLAVFGLISLAIIATMVSFSVPTLLDPELSLMEKASTAGYVVGDMLILVAITFAISRIFGSKFVRSWSIIFIAMILTSIADTYYTFFVGIYQTGNLVDILWVVDYMLCAFGFFYHRETVKSIISEAASGLKAVGRNEKNK